MYHTYYIIIIIYIYITKLSLKYVFIRNKLGIYFILYYRVISKLNVISNSKYTLYTAYTQFI